VSKASQRTATLASKKNDSTAAKAMDKRIKEGSSKALVKQTQALKRAEKAAAKEKTAKKTQGELPSAQEPPTTNVSTERSRPKRKAASTGLSYADDPDEEDDR
jgi:hypothetical protein